MTRSALYAISTWTAGFVLGALVAFALLRLTFVMVIPVALAAIWYGGWWRRSAGLGGLFAGSGAIASWAVVTSAAIDGGAWPAQATVWLVVSLALLTASAILTIRAWRRVGTEMDTPFPTERIIVLSVASLGAVAWFGLPLRLGEYPISTDLLRSSSNMGMCAGWGLDAAVRGSPTDPRIVWLENRHEDRQGRRPRMEAVWPVGYRARFTPELEVVDGWGAVILSDRDLVTGSCGERLGKPPEQIIGPPFE